jgi:hypothetical protein
MPPKSKDKPTKKSPEKQVAGTGGPTLHKAQGSTDNVANAYARLLSNSNSRVHGNVVSPAKGGSGFNPASLGVHVKIESETSVSANSTAGYPMYVAVIPGLAFLFWFDHGQIGYHLSQIVWKLSPGKSHGLRPAEEPVARDLHNTGVLSRVFKLYEHRITSDGRYIETPKEVKRGSYKSATNVFQIGLKPGGPAQDRESLFKFFTAFCKDVIDKLPVAIEKRIVTRPHYDSFVVSLDATYAEIIGRDAAQTRFKFEVGEPDCDNPDPQWFADHRDLLYKYFRPGTWWPELAALHNAPDPREVLTEYDYKQLMSYGLTSGEDDGGGDAEGGIEG